MNSVACAVTRDLDRHQTLLEDAERTALDYERAAINFKADLRADPVRLYSAIREWQSGGNDSPTVARLIAGNCEEADRERLLEAVLDWVVMHGTDSIGSLEAWERRQ